jgi:hypothetical protein
VAAIGPKADVEDRHLNASKTVALEVGADIQPSDQIMINMSSFAYFETSGWWYALGGNRLLADLGVRLLNV